MRAANRGTTARTRARARGLAAHARTSADCPRPPPRLRRSKLRCSRRLPAFLVPELCRPHIADCCCLLALETGRTVSVHAPTLTNPASAARTLTPPPNRRRRRRGPRRRPRPTRSASARSRPARTRSRRTPATPTSGPRTCTQRGAAPLAVGASRWSICAATPRAVGRSAPKVSMHALRAASRVLEGRRTCGA